MPPVVRDGFAGMERQLEAVVVRDEDRAVAVPGEDPREAEPPRVEGD
jgi:hypothetical protein